MLLLCSNLNLINKTSFSSIIKTKIPKFIKLYKKMIKFVKKVKINKLKERKKIFKSRTNKLLILWIVEFIHTIGVILTIKTTQIQKNIGLKIF